MIYVFFLFIFQGRYSHKLLGMLQLQLFVLQETLSQANFCFIFKKVGDKKTNGYTITLKGSIDKKKHKTKNKKVAIANSFYSYIIS